MFLLFLSLFVFVSAADYKNCELRDDRFACMKNFNDISDTVLTGVDNIEAIERLSELCSDYGKCAEGMKCQAEKVIIEHIQNFVILCGVFDLMKSEASRICEAKMEANRSTCYDQIRRTFKPIIFNVMRTISEV